MLGRLHHCVWVACLVLGVSNAYSQSLPSGAYGPYYGPAPSSNDYVDPNIVAELLPPDRGLWWDVDLRLNQAIEDTSHGMWFRLEYLNTKIDNPGNRLLGAPLANVPDPRQPFDVLLPNGATTTAVVLDTSAVQFDNINGIRGTWGVPLAFGHFEAMLWGTEKSTSHINTDLLPATDPLQEAQVVATSLLTNGSPGSTVILYDESFRAKYSTGIFSTETNFYYNYRNPRLGLRFLPVGGLRFVDYDESLRQEGVYSNTSGLNPGGILIDPLVRRIRSTVDNDLFLFQTGLRTEFAHQFFTLGMEPKLALGVNHYHAKVATFDLRDSPYDPILDDGQTKGSTVRDTVCPAFDFNLYAKVHLTDSLHVRVGWSYSIFGNMSRAADDIYYNDNGIANPPAVTSRSNEEWLGVSSLTLGGEYILP